MLKGNDIEKLFKGINLEGAKGLSNSFRSCEPIEKSLIDAVRGGQKILQKFQCGKEKQLK